MSNKTTCSYRLGNSDAAPPDAEGNSRAVRKRTGTNRQNIFITPLEIDKAVPDKPYIKKLKLSPTESSFGTKGQA